MDRWPRLAEVLWDDVHKFAVGRGWWRPLGVAWLVSGIIFLAGFLPMVHEALGSRGRLLPAIPMYVLTPIVLIKAAQHRGWI